MERQYVEYTVRKGTSKVGLFHSPLSKQDAYIIGRIAADGSYTYNHEKRFVRMGMSAKDVPFLEWLVNEYMPSTHVLSRDNRHITINNGIKDYHYITKGHGEVHFPVKFTEQLGKYGVVCHKPRRVLAGIPKAMFKHAVHGFFDGDGSVVVRHRKDCRTPRLNIHFVSGCETILNHLQREFTNHLGMATQMYARPGGKCFELRVQNTEEAIRFCKWLYSDAPDVFCRKKFEVFRRYMKSCVRSGEIGEGCAGEGADNPEPSPA
jgi:hypothetical protein